MIDMCSSMTVTLKFVSDDDSLRIYFPMNEAILAVRLYIHPISIVKLIGFFFPSDSCGIRVRIRNNCLLFFYIPA